MKSFIIILLFQFLILIVVSQPVNKLTVSFLLFYYFNFIYFDKDKIYKLFFIFIKKNKLKLI